MRLLKSVLKAVGRAAGDGRGPYALAGVNMTPDGIEATDGRILMRSVAKPEPEAGEEFKPRIVDADDVAAMVRDPLSKRLGAVNIRSNGTVSYIGAASGNMPARFLDAEFPDTKSVIPEREARPFSVCVSPAYLKLLCDAAMDVQRDAPCITLRFDPSDPLASIRMDAGDGDAAILGVLMPMSK